MKEWKKWKKMVAVLIISSQIAGILPVYGGTAATVFAEESEEEIDMPETISFEDSVFYEQDENMEESVGQEEGIAALQTASLDLGNISFQISDIRDSSKVTAFNGADGKQAVILFGNVTSCANTIAVLNALTRLASMIDMSKLNIYVFDIYGTSTEEILSHLGSVSEQIIVNSTNNNSDYYNLYIKCYRAAVGAGSFIMPLVIYKGTDGVAYEYTTGATYLDVIAENIRKGGMDINAGMTDSVLKVTGNAMYDEAYKVLEIVNQERAEEGLNALTMDEELLEAAMLRAAECSLYFSHTRPDGTICMTASGKMNGENIAMRQKSASEVMNSWMNSEGHRANILNSSYCSVGIGCFYFNGIYVWTQCFSMEEGVTGEKKSDQAVTYAVNAAMYLVEPGLLESSGSLSVGETKNLQVGVFQQWCLTFVDADSYEWESDSAAATVSEDGVITAVTVGNAIITGKNKANLSEAHTYMLTVTPKATATPEPTAKPTATPKPTAKPTTTPKPTAKPTATPKPTAKPTATPKPTAKPTATPKPTAKPTATPKPTAGVAAPKFQVVGVVGGRNVTFKSDTKDAVIYYSVSSSSLTASDKSVKNGDTELFENFYGSVYARAYYNGKWSNVSRLILKIPVVNTPEITCRNGLVTIKTSTPNSTIYYTKDGSTPSLSNGTRLTGSSGSFAVSADCTVKAIAVRSCFTNSEVAVASVKAGKKSAPSFAVKGVIGGREVTFNSEDAQGEIYYSFTTSNITTGDRHVKAGGKVLFQNYYGTVYAKTYMNGQWSNVSRLILKIPVVNKPTITPAGTGKVKISTTTPGCTIYYTTDGSSPSLTNGKKISSSGGIVTVENGKPIKAIAVRSCFTNSDEAIYTQY